MLQSLTFRPSGKQFTVTVTSKGQLTIPADIRRYWKLREHEKLALALEPADTLRFSRAKYPSAAGMLKKQLTWKQLREIARRCDHASSEPCVKSLLVPTWWYGS